MISISRRKRPTTAWMINKKNRKKRAIHLSKVYRSFFVDREENTGIISKDFLYNVGNGGVTREIMFQEKRGKWQKNCFVWRVSAKAFPA